MPRKKRIPISFEEKLKRIKKAGINHTEPLRKTATDDEAPCFDLDKRIKRMLHIFEHKKRNTMLYFVMYDIENDKIRTHISKYLIKKGCVRVQKSIFLADSKRQVYSEIHTTLRAVQEVYDNHDSIFLVPISADDFRAMKIIGENMDFDLALGNKNTLFF